MCRRSTNLILFRLALLSVCWIESHGSLVPRQAQSLVFEPHTVNSRLLDGGNGQSEESKQSAGQWCLRRLITMGKKNKGSFYQLRLIKRREFTACVNQSELTCSASALDLYLITAVRLFSSIWQSSISPNCLRSIRKEGEGCCVHLCRYHSRSLQQWTKRIFWKPTVVSPQRS